MDGSKLLGHVKVFSITISATESFADLVLMGLPSFAKGPEDGGSCFSKLPINFFRVVIYYKAVR